MIPITLELSAEVRGTTRRRDLMRAQLGFFVPKLRFKRDLMSSQLGFLSEVDPAPRTIHLFITPSLEFSSSSFGKR